MEINFNNHQRWAKNPIFLAGRKLMEELHERAYREVQNLTPQYTIQSAMGLLDKCFVAEDGFTYYFCAKVGTPPAFPIFYGYFIEDWRFVQVEHRLGFFIRQTREAGF